MANSQIELVVNNDISFKLGTENGTTRYVSYQGEVYRIVNMVGRQGDKTGLLVEPVKGPPPNEKIYELSGLIIGD